MKNNNFRINNKPINLSKRIGGGGEGDVYFIEGQLGKVAKIYHKYDKSREEKVSSMLRFGLSRTSTLISYPEDIIHAHNGNFSGFIMPFYDGYKSMHDLYGPKSRKKHFPKADYRFLVRAATNLARIVANVHSYPCVIGDFNHSGVLISQNATVALIDADSFQFELNGKTYPCLVGVPDFTPPELHGKSLTGVVRTKTHDQFALAVAIFQLLFMGRHPYAGHQIKGDLSLPDLIAKNMFAYSKIRDTGVTPPKAVANLDNFPPNISDGFEKAFGINPSLRPTANDWVFKLSELEKHLSKCSSNSFHYYSSFSKECPWCMMENTSGIVLFMTPFVFDTNDKGEFSSLDTNKIWSQIESISIPNEGIISPQYNFSNLQPSSLAKNAKQEVKSKKSLGAVYGLSIIIGGSVLFPPAAILWIIIGFFIWAKHSNASPDVSNLKERYLSLCDQWDREIQYRRQSSGIEKLHHIKKDLAKTIAEYEDLPKNKTQALLQLKTDRRNRHLNVYLDKFLLRDASISGIGDAKKTTLISFGIETAADVKKEDIVSIIGFGEATAEKLLGWRFNLEKRFAYNNHSNTAEDQQERKKLENDFSVKARRLANSLTSGQVEFAQVALTATTKLKQGLSKLEEIALEKSQIETDLKYLGISLPNRSTSYQAYSPAQHQTKPNLNTTASSASVSGNSNASSISCPICGSRMVRRTARRGRNSGNQFWGCSRYPKCKGTRN